MRLEGKQRRPRIEFTASARREAAPHH